MVENTRGGGGFHGRGRGGGPGRGRGGRGGRGGGRGGSQKAHNMKHFERRKADPEGNKRTPGGCAKAKKKCIICRKMGHVAAECKSKTNTDGAAVENKGTLGICFNCGSKEHSLKQCKKPREAGKLPFASCFVCGEQGHLSRDCEKNEKGVYVNGGCCKICGSVRHQFFECPDRPARRNDEQGSFKNDAPTTAFAEKKRAMASADEDDYTLGLATKDNKEKTPTFMEGLLGGGSPVAQPVKKKPKVVKF